MYFTPGSRSAPVPRIPLAKSATRGSRADGGVRPTSLEPYADAIFLAAVDEFQVLHFLVLHGEEKESGGGLFDFLFGEHLGVEEYRSEEHTSELQSPCN